jgi:hypothetical protein
MGLRGQYLVRFGKRDAGYAVYYASGCMDMIFVGAVGGKRGI